MKNIQLTHFYSWDAIPDSLATLVLREFADNGVSNMVLADSWSKRLVREPGFYSVLKGWHKYCGTNIFECHAPWGAAYDLNITDRPRRKGMISDHKMCMEYAADFGCRTYTVHIGPYYQGMEQSIFDALEQLIPAAEQNKIILAIENGFDPGNSPDGLLKYLTAFDSAYFGCCFDSGHANVMLPGPDKKMELYAGYVKSSWQNNIQQEADPIGKLANYLVTAHLHDNSGYDDGHMLAGTGTIDWQKWITQLKNCPRMISFQNEANALAYQYSIKKLCSSFAELTQI